MTVLILDNGAYSVKYGYSTDSPYTIPNIVGRTMPDKKVWLSDQLQECPNYSRLYLKSPFEKGYLVNWQIQSEIWNRLFSKHLDCNPMEMNLVLSEPFFNLPNIQVAYDEIAFEEYNFKGYTRASSTCLAAKQYNAIMQQEFNATADCILVVETGYSHTTIVPYLNGEALLASAKRFDIGGKVLTNYLKEQISFRHYNMMEETFIINELKEQISIVSTDFKKDMQDFKSRQSPLLLEYVLPDFLKRRHGQIKTADMNDISNDQVLEITNERIMIPELLFSPSSIGLEYPGLSQVIAESINSIDPDLQPLFAANIFLTGGNAKIPGMRDRMFVFINNSQLDLKSLLPDWYQVNVEIESDPQFSSWYGGQALANSDNFNSFVVTKQAYEEYGHHICKMKFKTLS